MHEDPKPGQTVSDADFAPGEKFNPEVSEAERAGAEEGGLAIGEGVQRRDITEGLHGLGGEQD